MVRFGITPQDLALNPATQPTGGTPDQAVQVAGAPSPEGRYFLVEEGDPTLPETMNLLPTPSRQAVLQADAAGSAAVPSASSPLIDQPVELSAAQEDALRSRFGAEDTANQAAAGQTPDLPAPPMQAQALQQPVPQPKRGLFASIFGRNGEPPRPSAPVQSAAAAQPAAEPQQEPAMAEPPQPAASPAALALVAPEAAAARQATAAAVQGEAGREQPEAATQPLQADAQPVVVAAAAATAVEPRKRNFLSSLFSNQAQASPQRTPIPVQPEARSRPQAAPTRLASLTAEPQARPRALYNTEALPGVRQGALFEIRRGDALDRDDDIDLYEDAPVQVASAAGLARLAPNGLLKQTDSVDVACLKPSLVRVLKAIEGRYGKKLIVTSGYRSPPRNRAARGASNSLHMYCAAADVQVPGVSKTELAAFVRAMPGRGGVGTYCHTNSVHVDVGPERDWNWRCRRRR